MSVTSSENRIYRYGSIFLSPYLRTKWWRFNQGGQILNYLPHGASSLRPASRSPPPDSVSLAASPATRSAGAAANGGGEHLHNLPAASRRRAAVSSSPLSPAPALLSSLRQARPVASSFRNHHLSCSRCRLLRSALLSPPCRSSVDPLSSPRDLKEQLPDPLRFSQAMVRLACFSFPLFSRSLPSLPKPPVFWFRMGQELICLLGHCGIMLIF